MRLRLVFATVLSILAIGAFAQSTMAIDDSTQHAKAQWQKDYTPGGAPVTADSLDSPQGIKAVPVDADLQLHMQLRPFDPTPGCTYNYPYVYTQNYPVDPNSNPREGFFTPSGSWWIGNQPFYPYYGYNPPTTDGYYPPYAFNNMNGYGGYGGYGGGYSSNYGQIVPAPPLASSPAYIPTFTTPVAPAPMRLHITPHGITTQRDPGFSLFFVPQPPSYLTTGSAIYQSPQPYYQPYYPPYYGPRR